MNTQIYFAKINANGIIPTKRTEDAGYDIYPCFEEDFLTIHPHETVLIGTGIASVCGSDYCFILKERGSTGTKGLGQRAGVIDSGFRGEWKVPITNHNKEDIVISKIPIEDILAEATSPYFCKQDFIYYPYEKAIAQAILVPVPTANVKEITYNQLKSFKSERGAGMLGSSRK